MLKVLLLSLALGQTVQVCEVEGVVTYTDRNDVCVEGEALALGAGSGTFSTVDAWDAVFPELPVSEEPDPGRVIIERHYYPLEAPPTQQRGIAYGRLLPFVPHHGFHGKRPHPAPPTKMEPEPPPLGPIWQKPNRTSQRGAGAGYRPVAYQPHRPR